MSHTVDQPLSLPTMPTDAENEQAFLLGGTVPFDKTTAEQEHTYHHYTGNAIPWFVRGIWIVFWCYAITYVILWFIPSLQSELLSAQ
jgi:hypothetical protein